MFNSIESLELSNYRDFWIILFAILFFFYILLALRTYAMSKLLINSNN
jgi:hypothetical protein